MQLNEQQNLFYNNVIAKTELKSLKALADPGAKFEGSQDVMQVHGRGYFVRLSEALGEMYKAVWYILGYEMSSSVCETFIRETPSTAHNLTLYGKRFPGYLARAGVSADFPFLKELAEFECIFNELSHSKQYASVSIEDIAGEFSRHPNCHIRFVPNLNLIHFEYKIYELWKASREKAPLDAIEWDEEEFLCMYKCDDQIFVKIFSSNEFFLLSDLSKGKTLCEALENEQLEDLEEEHIRDLFTWLATSQVIGEILS